MPDTAEAIALRLQEFIQAVDRKAGAVGFQTGPVAGQPPMRTKNERILQTYAKCLSEQLTDAERDEFDRLLRKISNEF
jgi:hypothetical protein